MTKEQIHEALCKAPDEDKMRLAILLPVLKSAKIGLQRYGITGRKVQMKLRKVGKPLDGKT